MPQLKLQTSKLLRIYNDLDTVMQSIPEMDGSKYSELLELQEAFAPARERAVKVEEQLKKKFPFKWNYEMPGFKMMPGVSAERVFLGSEDEKDEKIRAEKAREDRKKFYSDWDPYMEKEVRVNIDSDLLDIKEFVKGVKANGAVFQLLRITLDNIKQAVVSESTQQKN